MNPDMNTLRLVFDVVVTLAVFGNFWWSILDRKNRATAQELADHKRVASDAVSAISERLTKIESQVENAPSHADLARVYESINGLAATVNKLVGENSVQTDLLRMLVNKQTGGKS